VEPSASALERDAAGNLVLLGHSSGALDLGDEAPPAPAAGWAARSQRLAVRRPRLTGNVSAGSGSPRGGGLDRRPSSPAHGFSVAAARATLAGMTLTLKAQVRGGRLVLDEPTELPEGSEVELVLADDGDELDDNDRARLHASLQRSAEQFRAGRGIDADQALARLRG
jgi:hypothetical protein